VTGRVKWKVVPCPSTLSTQMWPPCCWTIRRQIARPSPIPSWTAREAGTRYCRSEIRSSAQAGMPIPSSRDDNPATLELEFPSPRTVGGLALDVGVMDFKLTVELFADGATKPVSYETTRRDATSDIHVELVLDRGPATVSRVRVKVEHLEADALMKTYFRDGDPGAGEAATIRIRELTLR
jgi:hypothetical protein